MSRIFLDNAATTALDPAVIDVMVQAMRENNGNPSSIHADGRRARTAIEQARRTVAQHLNASIGEIFFTSGGTEANNMVLKGAVRDLGVRRIISSRLEHHCVLHSLDNIEEGGEVDIVYLRNDEHGNVDLGQLRELLAEAGAAKTLVSLMHANNEIGVMIDLAEVGKLCREYGALFHTDTVQTIGYYEFDLRELPVDFLSGSGHKFHGPKGVGFVYIKADNSIKPFIDGGSQERNMRGGTENLYGILGLAEAMKLAYADLENRREYTRQLRDALRVQLREYFPDIRFNGDPDNGHYKLLSATFPPSPKADLLLLNLDIAGISASGGSACSSGVNVGSHVIAQLGDDSDDDRPTIRFSFSHLNTREEVDRTVAALRQILQPVNEAVKIR